MGFIRCRKLLAESLWDGSSICAGLAERSLPFMFYAGIHARPRYDCSRWQWRTRRAGRIALCKKILPGVLQHPRHPAHSCRT